MRLYEMARHSDKIVVLSGLKVTFIICKVWFKNRYRITEIIKAAIDAFNVLATEKNSGNLLFAHKNISREANSLKLIQNIL